MRTEIRQARQGEQVILLKDVSRFKSGSMAEVVAVGVDRVFISSELYVKSEDYVVAVLDVEEDFLEELEAARSNMNQLADEFGLMHQKVIEASQRLDGLLNRYDAMRKKE